MDPPPPVNPPFYYGSEPQYLHQPEMSSNADPAAPPMKATPSSSGSFSDDAGYFDYRSTPDQLGGMNSSMIPIESGWSTQHNAWSKMEDTHSFSSSYDVDVPKEQLAIPDMFWQPSGSMGIPDQTGNTKKEVPFQEFEPQLPMEDFSYSSWASYPWNSHNNPDPWADSYGIGTDYDYSNAGYYDSRSNISRQHAYNQEAEPLMTELLPADYLQQPHLSQPIQSSPVAAGVTTHIPTVPAFPITTNPEAPSISNISGYQSTTFHVCDGNPGTNTSLINPVHPDNNIINNMTSNLQPVTQMSVTSLSYPQPQFTAPNPINTNLQSDDARNSLLVEWKRSGLSYKDIKRLGKFKEAESTLRGRFRTLTKAKEQRVRKPKWQEKDVSFNFRLPYCNFDLLIKIHTEKTTSESYPEPAPLPPWSHSKPSDSNEHPGHTLGASSTQSHPDSVPNNQLGQIPTQPPKVSWKKVSEYIFAHGGSYEFGNATCKKKWCEIHGISI
ncbi:uncharacterized protein N7483_005947 [Penicillium malachiteum]|uniref:uncharacterized protein n=1 Tax=Penicillium malachiteum TaxID=1324776 RepID=UPI002548A09A|nr:uncharacterized protein N7483_005947 [Penicillium malachiteum]KAJ5731439.1 hypothetical protein N7483_005947 [Penicillium malachiteum]